MHDEQQMIPVGIGNGPAQQRFIQRHRNYVMEVPKLVELCNKVFKRSLAPPSESERQALFDANLPDDDPVIRAWEDRTTADMLIFQFGQMACDDFSAISCLSGNGAGFSAFIILRSMYERLVTAMYIARNLSEARAFADSSPIHKLNYLGRLRELIPEVKARYDDSFMDQVRQSAEAARAKRRESICSKCRQPITQEAWTRVSLNVMAREVHPDLENLYAPIYIEGTYQAHANCMGMERRIEETEKGYRYKSDSEAEAEASLVIQFAHRLMLRFIDMQSGHFNLNLQEEIRERFAAYNTIWGELQTRIDDAPSVL
jgi:hypothetical protein